VVVPTAFGLLFRRVPKWSAIGAIVWGLVVGVVTRYVIGWDIGPQVYLSFAASLIIFVSSYAVGGFYRTRRPVLAALMVLVTAVFGWFFLGTLPPEAASWQTWVAGGAALALGASLWVLARLFAAETAEERAIVEEFFRKLDTPVDVAREVFGAGRKQVSTFPLVGGTTIVMGLLMSLIFFTDMAAGQLPVLATMVAIMIVFGALMWYFGKRSEIRSAAEYARDETDGPAGSA
jgi:hypothetical protein